jgi:hypothetical protein
MIEFLKENYSTINQLVILIAILCGVYSYKNFKHTPVKYFIIFLVFVLSIEVISNYPTYLISLNLESLIKDTLIEQNYWWYTLTWTIGTALFFPIYYKSVMSNKILRRIMDVLIGMMILTVLYVVVFDFRSFFSSFPAVIEVVSFLVVVGSVSCYFIEILFSEKILSFYKSTNFYIASAVLFWWLVSTPLMFYEVYFSASDWDYVILKWQIRLLTNTITYLTFSYALLKGKMEDL